MNYRALVLCAAAVLLFAISVGVSSTDNSDSSTVSSVDSYGVEVKGATSNDATVIAKGDCGSGMNLAKMHWVLTSDGHMSITGSGYMYEPTTLDSIFWEKYKDKIVTLTVGSGVLSISSDSFSYFTVS